MDVRLVEVVCRYTFHRWCIAVDTTTSDCFWSGFQFDHEPRLLRLFAFSCFLLFPSFINMTKPDANRALSLEFGSMRLFLRLTTVQSA
jgi:hypothetical protein